jgi:hypothetical protein
MKHKLILQGRAMKNLKLISIIGILLMALSASTIIGSISSDQKSLADIYRTGKIRLIHELTINDESFPEDIFFESPVEICLDYKNNIYVCDYQADNIKVLDSSGKFKKTIGRQGQGPGEFQMPFHIAIHKDRLVVWELRNMRISVLNPEGEFIKSVQIARDEGWPRKIRALPNGDFVFEKVKTYRRDNEKPQECTIEIHSPDLELKKTLFTQEVWENKYIVTPVSTNVPQPFTARVYWDVSPEGKIFIGFSEDYIIEMYDNEKGRLSSFSHEYEPVKITEQDKKTYFAGMRSIRSSGSYREEKQGAPDYIVKNTKFPKHKPAFQSILVDGEGNILVFGYQKEDSEKARNFDAFDPEGKFISNVQIEGDVTFPSITRITARENCLWFIEQDEEGLFRIVKFRISN